MEFPLFHFPVNANLGADFIETPTNKPDQKHTSEDGDDIWQRQHDKTERPQTRPGQKPQCCPGGHGRIGIVTENEKTDNANNKAKWRADLNCSRRSHATFSFSILRNSASCLNRLIGPWSIMANDTRALLPSPAQPLQDTQFVLCPFSAEAGQTISRFIRESSSLRTRNVL